MTVIGCVGLVAASVNGQTSPAKPAPQTTASPTVPVDELQLLLLPLTKDELFVEADGWIGILKAKTTEISQAEIALKNSSASGRTTEASAGRDSASEPAMDRADLLKELHRLRGERMALVERVRAALKALSIKGGSVDVYEKYVAAVSGLAVDVQDAGAVATAVTDWVTSAQGGLRWVKNIVLFILTLIGCKILANIAAQAVGKALRLTKTGTSLLQDFLVNSARNVVLLIGAVVALSMLEVNVGPLVAAIGAAGFVVGFALQGTLSNFAAGVMILLYRPYDLGDTITVAGATGKVSSMTLVSTTIETTDRKHVVVPNSSIWGSAIHRHLAP